jgi:hypothetical protein
MLGAEGRSLLKVMGEPSDSKRNSYLLPFLSVAEQAMLETCPIAKFGHFPTSSSVSSERASARAFSQTRTRFRLERGFSCPICWFSRPC